MERNKKDKKQYDMTFDNLAIPEIHTGVPEQKPEEKDEKTTVTYDTVAVPEIHFRK